MKRGVMAIVLCVSLISLTVACGHKPPDIVKAYQEAYNVSDIEKIMSLYADEARFHVPGLFDLQGPEELRGLAEYDRVLHTVLEFSQLEVRGDTVMCQVKETNDWIETADIGEFYYQGIIVVRRGRIEAIEAAFTPETDRAFRRVMIPLMQWARAEQPELLAEMMPQDEFVYNAENAKKNLSLLREFKQNLHRRAIRPAWKKLGE